MQKLVISNNINIEDIIYEIRGKQVMLDSDLARLYQCTNGTKDINKAVKRNIERFPNDFYFQLTKEEHISLKFQFGTSKVKGRGGIRKLPYVFTEEGVAMLSSVLHTKIAVKVSIDIMNAFVKMRKLIKSNLLEQQYINELVLEHDKDIKILQEAFDEMEVKEKINTIFFDGQIYDAYSLLIDILNKSKTEIIIIDNYAGKELLDILKDIDKRIIIVSGNIDNTLIKKYKSQYNNIEFINNNLFHDRFIIIDKKILYSCGSSFKDLGKKCFAINKIEDQEYLSIIINKINKIV